MEDATFPLCACQCGGTPSPGSKFIRGHSLRVVDQVIHGMAGTPTYYSWSNMIQRCTNPKHHRYANYGARGITVCDRWRKFENFLADMGVKPDGHSIDRIDNDRGYEPGNCRWAAGLRQSPRAPACRQMPLEVDQCHKRPGQTRYGVSANGPDRPLGCLCGGSCGGPAGHPADSGDPVKRLSYWTIVQDGA